MVNRRQFLTSATLLPAALRAQQEGPAGPAVEDPVEKITPGERPAIAVCHVGFRPRVGRKTLVVRAAAGAPAKEFSLRSLDGGPIHFTRALASVRSDFGECLAADFTDLDRPGLYQINVGGVRTPLKELSEKPVLHYTTTVGGERSVPFRVDPDAWRRTLPKAIGYIHSQRCGVEVPGIHPACHLDDGRREDTGKHVDAVGGWHDAGDVRKGTAYTALMGVGLLKLLLNRRDSRPGDPPCEVILDEVRHGNRYFLKMQDSDGRIWGGLGQNRWTDNIIGTADDRPINPNRKPEGSTSIFACLQALIYQAFSKTDPAYATQCLAAGVRAWGSLGRPSNTLELARWVIAACELYRATRQREYRDKAFELGQELLSRQNVAYIGNQKVVRGFWMNQGKPYLHLVDGGLPPAAMLELYDAFPDAPDRGKWRDAALLHADEYLVPMSERNAYRLIPVGLYIGSPTPETYRPLAGDLTYRYFMPVRERYWWLGTSSHLLSNALFLGRLAQVMGEKGRPYVDLAYRQVEWIMGANPFGACLMTGVGARNPMPFSVFVGPIIGGVLNGIGGNTADEPVLNPGPDNDWRTGEYWSPHNAYYLWAHSVLEQIT